MVGPDINIEIVSNSFKRCMGRGLIERFYEIFLNSSPEVKQKFKDTNIERQVQVLQNGINFVIMFARGDAIGTGAIKRLRKSHSRAEMDIHPRLYSYWKTSFLDALSKTDPKFDAVCASAWDEVLQKTIDYIVAGYGEQVEE